MSLALHSVLILLLVAACYQDWKYRAVYWFVFPLIALDALLIFFLQEMHWQMLVLNLIFVTVVMSILFVYVSLRERVWTNIFKHHLGTGDVLFFLAVTPLFGSSGYVLFFISGMFLSAVFHGLMSLKKKQGTIPLAGYLSVYLLALKGAAWWLHKDLFYQNWMP